ncbi:MAG: tyrosine-type recombinase/integrase [Acutalibacteraceae bacterium]|nr:tyrosine-type recombinase/integrase [Acutalibacteraceae bacterium]
MAKARKDNRGRALRKGESQRTDNTYVYTYTDPFKKRRFVYAKDLQTLREKQDKLKREQLDGLDSYLAGNATLNFVFDRYMSTKYDLRKTTKSNYLYMYNHFVRDGFGERLIAELKYSDVKYFYLYLLNEKGLQANTVDTIHTILHPTFQLAVRDDIIRKNPSDGVMAEIKKKAGKNKGIRHALTIQQQRAFLNYIANEPVFSHWLPLFTVLLGTGCRIGEIIGLRWQDVDYENRIININHSVVYYAVAGAPTKKSVFQVSLPKTEAGIRDVPMMDEVYEALQQEYEYQRENGFNSTTIDGMTGFIFCNRFGNVHNPQTVNRTIKRILENYNAEEVLNAKKERRQPVILPHFSCHHLRHTFCTRLCENESNLKVIQAVMGHANIETTMDIYAEATAEKKKEAIENLSKNIKLF